MSRLKRNVWFCITVLFGTALLTFAFHHMVLHPGHVVTGLVEDGSKNNLTYVYRSMWGHGIWFDGMNYPFGEHIVYTDGQPVLNKEGAVDNVILRDPGGYGFFIFSNQSAGIKNPRVGGDQKLSGYILTPTNLSTSAFPS